MSYHNLSSIYATNVNPKTTVTYEHLTRCTLCIFAVLREEAFIYTLLTNRNKFWQFTRCNTKIVGC